MMTRIVALILFLAPVAPARRAQSQPADSGDDHAAAAADMAMAGPMGGDATQSACDAVGGRFVPRLFGWMVHVDAFAGDSPAAIWSATAH